MKAKDAVKEIMKIESVKIATLESRLGVGRNVVSERLNQENISVVKLNEMLRALDYKIVICPRETVEKENWYKVD